MQVKLTVRDDIYKQLKEEANRNFRTITEEINYRLSKSLSNDYVSSHAQSHTQSSQSSLHYPEGVRSAENSTGSPVITNDYNSYYEESKKTARRGVIQWKH